MNDQTRQESTETAFTKTPEDFSYQDFYRIYGRYSEFMHYLECFGRVQVADMTRGSHREKIKDIFRRKAERGYTTVTHGIGPLKDGDDYDFIWVFEHSNTEPGKITTLEGTMMDTYTAGPHVPVGLFEADYSLEGFMEHISSKKLVRNCSVFYLSAL